MTLLSELRSAFPSASMSRECVIVEGACCTEEGFRYRSRWYEWEADKAAQLRRVIEARGMRLVGGEE